jgi:hypothetical protein
MGNFRSVTGKPANLRNRNRVLGKNQLAKSMEENFQMPVDALAHIQVLQENCLERPILKMQVHWQKVVVLFFSELNGTYPVKDSIRDPGATHRIIQIGKRVRVCN